MSLKRVNVGTVGRLAAFCHATVAGDFIYVSGTLGTLANSTELIGGGTGPQTLQTMRNIEAILRGCGASLTDLVKVNVYLQDIETFNEMNEAYLSVIDSEVPSRITVGGAALALGAAVEIDCVAYKAQ